MLSLFRFSRKKDLRLNKNFKSFRYFRCLANGQVPPVKERLEVPVATQKTDTGLTNGIIKTLHKQVFYFNLTVKVKHN